MAYSASKALRSRLISTGDILRMFFRTRALLACARTRAEEAVVSSAKRSASFSLIFFPSAACAFLAVEASFAEAEAAVTPPLQQLFSDMGSLVRFCEEG